MTKSLLMVLAALILNGCGENAQGVKVEASSYGEQWPLNVPSAILNCIPPSVVFIEANGVQYALNGKALREGYPPPDPIRKDTNSILMADFTERAMQICFDKRN